LCNIVFGSAVWWLYSSTFDSGLLHWLCVVLNALLIHWFWSGALVINIYDLNFRCFFYVDNWGSAQVPNFLPILSYLEV
jgi:hypothetical protein